MTIEIDRIETLHEGWGRMYRATLRLADGEIVTREIEDHGSAVAVLPYDPERRTTVLVSQMRAPMLYAEGAATSLEAPAGTLDVEDPEDCARREALEEAGLRLSVLEPAGRFWSMPGVSTERIHLFLAPYSAQDRVADGGGLDEEQEYIEVHELGLAELARMADEGRLVDMKTFALLQTLRLRHPELFEDRGA